MKLANLAAGASLLAFASVASAALTPGAGPNCAKTDVTPNASFCSGAWDGNDANQQPDVLSELNSLLAGTWVNYEKIDAGNNGSYFTSVPGAPSGTITFAQMVYGDIALALKSANQFWLYVWDDAPGVSSIDFTLPSGQELSHATLYGASGDPFTPPPIPEPSTYAMMLAGIAAMGLVARRRSRKS